MENYTPPTPGSVVEVVFKGKVEGAGADFMQLAGGSTLDWSETGALVSCRTITPAYTPELGDVALWAHDTGAGSTPVTYVFPDGRTKGWYMAGRSTLILLPQVDIRSDRFKLIVRGGELLPSDAFPPNPPSAHTSNLPAGYTPQVGDVGVLSSIDGQSDVVVQYRRVTAVSSTPAEWRDYTGRVYGSAHRNNSFQLVLRNGKLQDGINV